MLMLFSSLSLFGFFIFLTWIIIAIITKEQKNIPIIGIILSTVIFVTGVSLPTSASTSTNILVNRNNGHAIILAAKSNNNELRNVIAKNISDTSTVNTYYSQVNNSDLKVSSDIEKKNNTTNDSIVVSNSEEQFNYKISKQQGLKIVNVKVKIEAGIQVLYDSERVIKDKVYYLYTLNTDQDTLDDFAYCVDVNSGELFKCSTDMILSLIE